MMSLPPAGANPTIQRTGFAGYDCAHTMRGAVERAAAPAARCRNWRRRSFMRSSTVYAVLRVQSKGARSANRLRPFYGSAKRERYGDLSAAADVADGRLRGATGWRPATRGMSKWRGGSNDGDC